jgi:capsular polysaccharide biosynthesis protein
MDVSDVVRRVLFAHWLLILGLALIGVGAASALHYDDVPIYTSDVRFLMDGPDPQSLAESTASADTAKSIATSPSHVSAALTLAGVHRDVIRFATRNIELQPLGTSGVMDLQVKDTNAATAAEVANALAIDVVASRGGYRVQGQQLLASLDDQIKATDASIAAVDAQIASYVPSSDPSVAAARLSGLYSERTSLSQQRLSLQTERDQISQSVAQRPQAGIIDPAVPATLPDPSRAPIDMALGGLGGIVLGVMLASLLAVLRPRISGQRQIEQALNAPVLGDFDPLDEVVESTLGARIRIAAIRSGVKHLQLVAVEGTREAVSLASMLTQRLGSQRPPQSIPVPLNGNGEAVARPRRKTSHSEISVVPYDPSAFSLNGNATDTGLVLITPAVLRKRHLEASANVNSVTGWPVLGVVTYSRRATSRAGLGHLVRDVLPLRPEGDPMDEPTFRPGLK